MVAPARGLGLQGSGGADGTAHPPTKFISSVHSMSMAHCRYALSTPNHCHCRRSFHMGVDDVLAVANRQALEPPLTILYAALTTIDRIA